jgi:hypothetical protein
MPTIAKGKVEYFASDAGTVMNIGLGIGVLTYPHKSGDRAYEDSVTFAENDSQGGVYSEMLINLGSVYSLMRLSNLVDLLLDHKGKSKDGTGRVEITMFADDETTPFYAANLPVDSKAILERLPPRSHVERLRVRIRLVNDLDNIQSYALSKMSFGHTPQPIIGNI